MTWLESLGAELSARGVPPRDRDLIVLELNDHIKCEPGCDDRLGDPRELAVKFADELATSRARRSALYAFLALALTAVALATSQLAIEAAGGYPGFTNGISLLLFFPALVGIFFAPQVALVTGSLAALRAIRRRRTPRLPAAEIGLITRRARIALLAGFGTVAGLWLYLANFATRFPGWYLSLMGGLSVAAAVALAWAYRDLRRAQTIVSASPGAAGDVYDDVPLIGWRWLRNRPWRLGLAGSLIVGVGATAVATHAERSLQEGLQRGLIEGLGCAIGFALLGRSVGLFSNRVADPQLANSRLDDQPDG
jgi:hypothetical protein